MESVYAGIVTYNPEIALLEKNINSIKKQVVTVIVVDNNSANVDDIKKLSQELNVEIINNKQNMGIAFALNQLMQYGKERNFQWMISLDQDSVCPDNYWEKIKEFRYVLPNIGIIGPVIRDRKIGIVGHNPKGSYGIVNTCITSGACVRMKAWEDAGGYDEKMFIDSVDFEFCYKIRKEGYLVIQTREVILEHSLGNAKIVKLGLVKKKIKERSAFRYFYIAQNEIYYPRKHRLYLYLIRGNIRNVEHIISILLFEEEKKEKVKAIFKGWKSGYNM